MEIPSPKPRKSSALAITMYLSLRLVVISGFPNIYPEPAGPGLYAKPSFSTQVIRVSYRGYRWSPLLSNNETF